MEKEEVYSQKGKGAFSVRPFSRMERARGKKKTDQADKKWVQGIKRYLHKGRGVDFGGRARLKRDFRVHQTKERGGRLGLREEKSLVRDQVLFPRQKKEKKKKTPPHTQKISGKRYQKKLSVGGGKKVREKKNYSLNCCPLIGGPNGRLLWEKKK